MSRNVLLVTEGSGGHLIPALEVAKGLAKHGVRVKLWYAERPQLAGLMNTLVPATRGNTVDIDPLPVAGRANVVKRVWQCGQLWRKSQRCFDLFAPDVVVGFGGWISAPVLCCAHRRGISAVLHEQNVQLGRANRLVRRWVDRVAISFPETRAFLNGTPSVTTGLPVRESIGHWSRRDAATYLQLDPERPTILVLGGSQGAAALNRLMGETIKALEPEECARWQVMHITGPGRDASIKAAYAHAGMRAQVVPFVTEMGAAYALSDVAVSRAGASSIAELAQCALPAIFVPYPHAGAHQMANARVVEAVGGAVVLEQAHATPERLLILIRSVLTDERLRAIMGTQIQRLAKPDAAERLVHTILDVVGSHDD